MIPYVTTPMAHQREGVERALNRTNFFFIWDPGTGKSKAVIDVLRNHFAVHAGILRTLIVCPPVVVKKWRDTEFRKHSKVPPEDIICLTGSGKERLKLFEKFKDQPKIFITNYESLLMDDLYKAFEAYEFQAFVFDESHKLKNPTSKRAKAAYHLANQNEMAMKFNLTGTAVLNTPLDLFQQCKVLDGGKMFGHNFFGFRARYFIDRNAGMPRDKYFPKWEIAQNSMGEINEKLSHIATRAKKEECLDLPPMVREIITVDMLPDQKKAYDAMKRDYVTFIGERAASANLAIVKALRLMQIASGYLPYDTMGDEERSQKTWDATPKLQALKDLLEEYTPTSKVLVWATWRENYGQIKAVCDRLGLGSTALYGGLSSNERDASLDLFDKDDACRVLIGHPGAGGIGVDLVNAGYSIFYSRTFSLEQSIQAEARNYRQGSLEAGHKKVTRIDLVCGGTIDEEVVKRLHQKEVISESVLREVITRG